MNLKPLAVVTAVLGVATLALLHSCSAPVSGDCSDGRDNDGDGLIDYDDFGCLFSDGIVEVNPPECSDGLDNDGDGATDLEDVGCESRDDSSEDDPQRECNDGFDNDGDGLIDFPNDSGCTSATDDMEFKEPECSDGLDNDDDGVIDYPLEPGCITPSDDSEDDPIAPPECSDGADNDLDGASDYPGDVGCESAGDNSEFNVTVGACGPTVLIEDITVSQMSTGSITGPTLSELYSTTCGGFGGESAFTLQVDEVTGLRISTDHPETTLDTVVYVRSVCQQPESEVLCSDDSGVLNRRASVLNLPLVMPGTYYIIVDAFSPGSLGDFKLTVELKQPIHSPCDPADADACLPGLVCREVTPGAGTTCELPVCSDGVDNDMDGLVDYPYDPGCTSPLSGDEQFPNPLTECSDGVDNDLDGDSDFGGDSGCTSAADDIEETCGDSAPLIDVTYQPQTLGVTVAAGAEHTGTCAATVNAPEVVHRLRVPGTLDSLSMSTDGSSYDTVLYLRQSACNSVELACDNNSGAGSNSTFTISNVSPNDYYIFVDGWNTSSGGYQLTIAGTIADGAICDIGQIDAGIFACDFGKTCMDDGAGARRCL